MFGVIRDFFCDPVTFRRIVGGWTVGNRLRGLIATAGMLLLTGVVPLESLSAQLGTIGLWIGRALLVAAFFVRSGGTDATLDVLTRLTPEQAQQLKGQLQRVGVVP